MKTTINRMTNAVQRLALAETEKTAAIAAWRSAVVDLLTVIIGEIDDLAARLDALERKKENEHEHGA